MSEIKTCHKCLLSFKKNEKGSWIAFYTDEWRQKSAEYFARNLYLSPPCSECKW